MSSSLFFPSLSFFLAAPLLARSFVLPLGMVVLMGGLVEAEEFTLGGLLDAKIGAGAAARAAGVVSNLIGDHSSAVASAFLKSALPFMVDCLTIFLSFSFLIQAALCSILARQLPEDRSRNEGQED